METQNVVAVKEMKREATNLAQMLKQEFGCQITHSEALERIARLRDFDNWDTAVACVGRKHSEIATNKLSRRDQFAQILGLHAVINNVVPFSVVLKTLQSQPNEIAAKGWNNISYDEREGIVLSDTLGATELFDDDVLTIANIAGRGGDLGASLCNILEYLKTTMH